MFFIQQGKTNWQFLAIVIIVAIFVGGIMFGVFEFMRYSYFWPSSQQIQSNNDETAGWQTYRNEEYGFEIKYPSDLDVSAERVLSTGMEVDFYKVSQVGGQKINDIIMSVRAGVHYSQELIREYTLDEWINASFPSLEEGESKKNIIFGADNYEGIKVEAYKSVGVIKLIPYVFIQKDRDIYEITGNVPSLVTEFPKAYEQDDLFNQMLSTFRFTE